MPGLPGQQREGRCLLGLRGHSCIVDQRNLAAQRLQPLPQHRDQCRVPGASAGQDPRTPDIIVTPNIGVTYSGSTKKLAEHGGFSHDDTDVMMLLSNPAFTSTVVWTSVQTAQIAPTILGALGLNPDSLQAVQIEGTQVLPGLGF